MSGGDEQSDRSSERTGSDNRTGRPPNDLPSDQSTVDTEHSSVDEERLSTAGKASDQIGDSERTPLNDNTPRVKSEQTDSRSQNPIYRLYHADEGPLVFLREILLSVIIVLLIGGLLFGISGVWPPMVAIESGSMEPNIKTYDLVLVTEPGRLTPDSADKHGIVTYREGEASEYTSFNNPGSVIVFDEPGGVGPPVIHRPHFSVDRGENWVQTADDRYTNGRDCEDLETCPAPRDGYITKGDNNGAYDQVNGVAPVVDAEWITGIARLRIPYLGWIRLAFTGQTVLGPTVPLSTIAIVGGLWPAIGRRPEAQKPRR